MAAVSDSLVIMLLDHVVKRLGFPELFMKLGDLDMNNLENRISMRDLASNHRLT